MSTQPDVTPDSAEPLRSSAEPPRRDPVMGGIGVGAGLFFFVYGLLTPYAVLNWFLLGIGVMFLSLGIDYWLLMLPRSRLRSVLRFFFATPHLVLGLLFDIGGIVYNVIVSLFLLLVFSFLLMVPLFLFVIPGEPNETVLVYFTFLTALAVAAYARDRVLLPIRWMYAVGSRKDGPEGMIFRRTVMFVRAINFRRLAYQLAIAGYLYSVADSFGASSGTSKSFAEDAALAALLGFLALDNYIAAFHPSLVCDRPPLQYRSLNGNSDDSTAERGVAADKRLPCSSARFTEVGTRRRSAAAPRRTHVTCFRAET